MSPTFLTVVTAGEGPCDFLRVMRAMRALMEGPTGGEEEKVALGGGAWDGDASIHDFCWRWYLKY